ncbi:MAG: PAS domain-containing protein, partial [Alphaproteobacteria bacterium]|nr:PAS domain-containing protein [Alphaproteobacteria bacterium]
MADSGLQVIDFRAVFDASPNPYVLLNRSLTVVGMNKAFLDATSMRRRDILSREIFDVLDENPGDPSGISRARARASFERVLREGETDTVGVLRYDVRRPPNFELERHYWCEVNAPITGKSGEVAGILSHFVNVTEFVGLAQHAGVDLFSASSGTEAEALLRAHALRQTNKALDAELRYLRSLFMQAPGYIRVHRGPEHIVELSNPAAAELFGDRKLLGKPIREAYPELVEQGYVRLLDRVLATGEPYVGREASVMLRRRTDAPPEMRYVDFVYQPIFEENGSISGVFVQGADVTEHRRAKDELRRYRDSLEDLVRARTRALEEAESEFRRAQSALDRSQRLEIVGQLTGGIAHDFNNLLTVVIGNLELVIARLGGDERALSLVGRARQAAERGEKLTKQLLAFGRRQSLHPEVVDVNRMIADATPLIEGAAGARIEIERRLFPSLWLCRVDPVQFEATLLNIVLNARDAIGEHGKIFLETDNIEVLEPLDLPDPKLGRGKYVRVRVADTGRGMQAHVLERAFEPFFTTKEVGAGSGLGL